MPRKTYACRPLYLMAKPPADVARSIHALPRCDRRRGADLLHMTLAAFGDLARAPAGLVELVIRGIDDFGEDFRAGAFPVQFDRIECRRATTLRSSVPLLAAWDFQRQLAGYFQRHGFTSFNLPAELHITLDYRSDGLGSEAVAALGWTVEEVLLVESVVGEGRHIVHGRWPLGAPEPTALFDAA